MVVIHGVVNGKPLCKTSIGRKMKSLKTSKSNNDVDKPNAKIFNDFFDDIDNTRIKMQFLNMIICYTCYEAEIIRRRRIEKMREEGIIK